MDLRNLHIILASGSPRRLEILRAHGIEPQVIVPRIDEGKLEASLSPLLRPQELAQQLAMHKARAVLDGIQGKSSRPRDSLILAADTIVYRDEVGVLGKPADKTDAIRILRALCDTAHEVVTGVAAIDLATGNQSSLDDTTIVHFGEYGLPDIEEYLAAEPPFDKAGSYAIQGMWNKHVTLVEGNLENVIGLPYYRIEELLNNLAN